MTIRSKALFLLWTAAAFTPLAAEAATATLFVCARRCRLQPRHARSSAGHSGGGPRRLAESRKWFPSDHLGGGRYSYPALWNWIPATTAYHRGRTRRTVLYGGNRVTGWRRDGEQVLVCRPAWVKEGTWDFRALVVNGRLPDRARCRNRAPSASKHVQRAAFPSVGGGWERKPTQEELTTMPTTPRTSRKRST